MTSKIDIGRMLLHVAKRKGGWIPPFRNVTRYLGMTSVEAVGSLGNALVDNGQGGIGGIFQGNGQCLFLLGREGGKHPVSQIIFRIGLAAYPDLNPGEGLPSS